MSTEAFTLQCHRCAGYFRAAGEARSKVRCPHCEWVALVAEFRQIGDGESPAVGDGNLPAVGDAGGSPAAASTWEIKGKHLQFGCPHCERPMRLATADAGGLADCPHCGLEVVAPDPDAGSAARLSEASLRGLGGLADFKPRQLRAGGMRTPIAPVDDVSDEIVEAAGAGEVSTSPNPFEEAAAAFESPRAAPVRMLGVEELGAAFKAREDLELPQALGWESEGVEFSPSDAPAVEPLPRDGRRRVFAFAALLFLGSLGIMFLLLESQRGKGEGSPQSAASVERSATEAADDARYAAAFDVARRAVGAGRWQDMVPLVRSGSRVGAVMAEFYGEREFRSVNLVAFEDPVTIDASGTSYVQLRVEIEGGQRRLIGIEETDDGQYFFDWELWVDIARVEWHDFVKARPSEPRRLRVTVTRNSPQARYLEDAGIGREEARGIRLWLDNNTEPLFAILPSDDPAADAIWQEVTWDLGRRVVAELSFPHDAKETDRVRVHRIIQPRWLLP